MSKKMIMSLGISAAALSLSSIEANAAQTLTVTTSVLNVRTGAGTNYSIMSKVYEGDTLEVIGSSNGWYNVKLSSGKTGWVSGDYVSVSGSSSDTSTTIKTGIVNTSVLNVRSGASTSYSIIGKVYSGNTVEIIGSSNGWYNIKLSGGKTGWVSGDYVNVGGSSNDTNTTIKTGIVNTSVLNVRSGASTSYSIIGKVYSGNTVEIVGSSNGWYNIKLSSGKTGWVSGDYVNVGGSSNDTSTTIKTGIVNTSVLNVRSGASTSYSIIGKVYSGNTVEIIGSSNGWYNIKLSGGKTGWVSADYVNVGGSSSNSGSTVTNKAQAIVDLAIKQIGKPYVWGAEGPNSFDCSGLTFYVYKNALGITLPRTSTEQSKTGTTVSRSNLQPGDLIFSSTNGSGSVSHVGIYIGNGEMIHAPKPGDTVKKTNINTTYWNNAYLWAKRYI